VNPFAPFNLRWNPFGEPPPSAWAELALCHLEGWIEALSRPGFVLELIGGEGRGKSTHLRALHAHFPSAPFRYVAEGEVVRELPDAPLLFVDESQRLPRRLRRSLLGPKRSLVLATHATHEREYRRARVDFQCLAVACPDGATMRAIVERRLRWAQRGAGPVPCPDSASMKALWSRYGDDLRSMEGYLYELYQGLRRRPIGECHVEMRDLDRIESE
jgi:hypothetical protein